LKETQEDILLDAVIGLEILLSDTGQDLKYKLAMRMADLSTFCGSEVEEATAVFTRVKDLYNHRSDIVHGNVPSLRKRGTKSEKRPPDESDADAARRYLGLAISALALHPEYRRA
jgi:hypothetical protein